MQPHTQAGQDRSIDPRGHVYSGLRWLAVAALLVMGPHIQGCLAVAWVTAVTVDLTRTSEVEFQPFENSWTAPKETWLQHRPTKGIAVALDAELADSFTTVLQQQLSSLRVVRVGKPLFTSEAPRTALNRREKAELQSRAGALTKRLQVDAILVGEVVEASSEEALLGLKARSSKRLYLRLLNKEGLVIWRSELPFVVVQGGKALDQDDIDDSLARHLKSEHGDFRLPDLINSETAAHAS